MTSTRDENPATSSDAADVLLVDEPSPGVRRLTLNRPERLNALTRGLANRLIEELERVQADDSVRVVLLAANGPSFCAGADFDEHFQEDGFDIGRTDLWERIETLRVPVIAAVQGWVMTGGFLLTYCCDILVAASDTKFRDTHAALGLIPTGGESQRMPRRLGPFVARDLMLTSRALTAEDAHRIGFVSQVVPVEELEAAALAVAEQVVANSPRVVAILKQLINLGTQADLGVGRRLELLHNDFGTANNSDDADRRARIQAVRDRSRSARDRA
ncbi:enoyl-CoA hydratase/isomerase family protein [Nocardioides zeae]|uniref:Enoyl-CoA hydratase/isomerase family protein n=1 Tax=Nocardioides zeae TaxID=1457234 RepID=A0A6P0HLZ4_9ACTN|nr:enoyl-CoA hydratase/isomerase family protein [Nocardioides zeae]NEN79739.1 enoyl-CoA hydratase/isomerase family protein [Nocardioides zeae]